MIYEMRTYDLKPRALPTRYREDGSVIGRYFSLYVVTCQDSHWGIQVGSGNGT